MTQVINHTLGHRIVHNPGHDFDLGYKKYLNFFITHVLNLLPVYLGYALEEQFLLCTTYTVNKFKTWLIRKIRFFYNLGQNHDLGYEQFYNLGYDL